MRYGWGELSPLEQCQSQVHPHPAPPPQAGEGAQSRRGWHLIHRFGAGNPMKIYLAGPDVFLPDAIEIGRRKAAICARHGVNGLYPLDNAIDLADGGAALRRS